MSKRIHAIFDGTDMAELARMRLKREGIEIESFEIEPVANRGDSNDIDFIINPTAQNGYTGESFWTGSLNVQPYGGVLLGTNSDTFENRTLYDDIYSKEVSMIVAVPDGQVGKAEAILRSCHGYGIRIK